MLADGGEYRGRYGLSVRELERFHRPRIETLVAGGPDVLALETVPDTDEAEALLRAVEGCGVPVWLSYSVEGQPDTGRAELAEAFALAAGDDQVIAVGRELLRPRGRGPGGATRGLGHAASRWWSTRTAARSGTRQPRGGWARGKGWGRGGGRGPSPLLFTSDRVRGWQSAGARLLGGCCRVGPARIADVVALLDAGRGDR